MPIEDIQRKKLWNEVDHGEVLHTLTNFDQEVWNPVMIDGENYLVDGQHRLVVATQLCMRYIDVVVRWNNQ